ncbi:hypothetical protein ACFFU1_04515 [Algibacter miyuki]|uniref:Uncharacterized protein n=1 Tax=Algibacter miyuki TaxID=1306933 RepID=A0ABV5GXD1_9FLAO|nr:hypothetical protein [Algibacter miyuki]MDN3666151.1 hypothetical protein [Algibacter miyuki]
MSEAQNSETDRQKNQSIYLSIDHLQAGDYQLNITLKNKVLKTIPFHRET